MMTEWEKLVSDAAEATEYFTEDELEQYANLIRLCKVLPETELGCILRAIVMSHKSGASL